MMILIINVFLQTWIQRFENLWLHLRFLRIVLTYIQRLSSLRKSFKISSSLQEGTRKRCIQTSVFGLSFAVPLSPFHFMVGPIIPDIQDGMPEDLRSWLENKRNIIYVSFGTTVAPSALQWQHIIEGLKKTGYQVLISARTNMHQIVKSFINNSDKFLLVNWVPQLQVLKHPSVAAFVSHCGFGSTSEALYFGKPLLAIPYLADQHDVAARVEEIGAGIRLDKDHLSTELVRLSVAKLVLDSRFKVAASRCAVAMRNAGGIKRAADICTEEMKIGSSHLLPLESNMHPLYFLGFIAFICILTIIYACIR